MALREYYGDIIDFIGSGFRYGLHFGRLERKTANQDDGEKARVITYDFITRTQGVVREPDLKIPLVFDLSISEKRDDEATVQIGLASAHKIAEAKLTLAKGDVEKSVQSISTQMGLQVVNIKGLTKGITYNLTVMVKTENDGGNAEYLTFVL